MRGTLVPPLLLMLLLLLLLLQLVLLPLLLPQHGQQLLGVVQSRTVLYVTGQPNCAERR